MPKKLIQISQVSLFFALCYISQLSLYSSEITITIDDAPMPDSQLFTGIDRTQAIIQSLALHKIESVALFCIGKNAEDPEGFRRLQLYSQNGHLICNHSYSHQHLRDVEVIDFENEINKTETILGSLPTYTRWFRYPYLDYGSSPEQSALVRETLSKLNYQNAYTTINTFDWYINSSVQKALKNGKSINKVQLKNAYLTAIWDCIQFYEKMANFTFDSCYKEYTHVLLLHENDLTALYIGDLIELLRNNNWKIVSPTQAYTGPFNDFFNNIDHDYDSVLASHLKTHSQTLRPHYLSTENIDKLLYELKVFE